MDLRVGVTAARDALRDGVRAARRGSRLDDAADDDFDWRRYTSHYRRELVELEREHTTLLAPDDYAFREGRLEQLSSRPPLHPNHRLVYETVGLLAPRSVVEAGCGGGDHLANLAVCFPDLQLSGVDRSQEQLDFLVSRSPSLQDRVRRVDLTLPLPADHPVADVCFTQAVVMHIKTGNGHRVALANLFSLATRQVVLMENWLNHAFLDDVRRLHADGIVRWPDLHTYVRRAPELGGRPHLVVVSAEPLDLEPLVDYSVLTDPMR